MVLINKKTFEIYTRIVGEDYDKNEYFECDELLAPTIYNLNSKGYLTEFCCSGHIYPEKQKRADGGVSYVYDNFYITFKEKYDFDFKNFPERAWMDGNTLRIDIDTMTDIYEERRDLILKACDEIWKWSISLKTVKEIEEEKYKARLLKSENLKRSFELFRNGKLDNLTYMDFYDFSIFLAVKEGLRAEETLDIIITLSQEYGLNNEESES